MVASPSHNAPPAPILVRRSNLLVSATDRAGIAQAWRHNADAITLDLETRLTHGRTENAETLVKDAISIARAGGAELFVRVGHASIEEDIERSLWPGLTGIMLPNVQCAADVLQAAQLVAARETERGLRRGSVCFILLLASARAVWDIRSIVRSCSRISQIGLDEKALAADLGIDPDPELDPFVYARGRLAIEATAAGVGAIGMAYPLSVHAFAGVAVSEVHALATKAKNLGMKGVICPHAEWVAPVNAAFTPTPDLVTWNRRVRIAFAAGVAAGTAAVPLDGRMIDVPVDEWAKVVIATAEACAARDAEKQAALEQLRFPS